MTTGTVATDPATYVSAPVSTTGIIAVVYDQPDEHLRAFLDGLGSLSGGPYPVWLAVTKPGRSIAPLGEGVTVVPLQENLGWTGGANAAAVQALAGGCRDLVLMNTDVQFLSADLVERLVGALRSAPDVGFVSPTITTFPDTSLVWYRGATFSSTTWITRHPRIGASFEVTGTLVETSYPSGCCMAVRGETFAELGGFDETLFGYFDEADLSYRARARGWRSMLLDVPLLAHDHRGSELTAVAAYYFGRNPLVLSVKHRGAVGRAIALCAQLAVAPYYLARCVDGRARRAYLRGLRHGIAHLCGRPHVGKGHGDALVAQRTNAPVR